MQIRNRLSITFLIISLAYWSVSGAPALADDFEIPVACSFLKGNSRFAEHFWRRTGPIPPVLLAKLQKAEGNDKLTQHEPTLWELYGLIRVLLSVPAYLTRYLDDRMIGYYFVDGLKSNALTIPVRHTTSEIYSFMVFESENLRSTLEDRITERDYTMFERGDAEESIHYRMPAEPALQYFFLHEATHVADLAIGMSLTPADATSLNNLPFVVSEVWRPAHLELVRKQFPYQPLLSFYGNKTGRAMKIPIANAYNIYARLLETPFATPYGAQNPSEDIAELIAFSETCKSGMECTVVVNGRLGTRTYPLSERQRLIERYQAVKLQLERHGKLSPLSCHE